MVDPKKPMNPPKKQTARKSLPSGYVPPPKTVQTARMSLGGGPPPGARKKDPITDTRTALEEFGTIDLSEPIELPHGARDVRCTDDTATAIFDIPLSHLRDFGDIDAGRFARHQISEPFFIAGLWWVLGIEKKTQHPSSRSQFTAQLFCVSLKHRLSATSLKEFPLRWKINRGDHVFCAETGQAFDAIDGLVLVKGSFAFSIETGLISGTSSLIDFAGQPFVLHGAGHQSICGIVLDSVSDYDIRHSCGEVIVLTVKFMGDPPVRVRVVSESGEDGEDGDGKQQEGSEKAGKKPAGKKPAGKKPAGKKRRT